MSTTTRGAWDGLGVAEVSSRAWADPLDGLPGPQTAGDRLIVGADTRRAIAGTTRVPFRWIVNVEVKIGGRWRSNGSGTLIGPRTVLTAGHVVQFNAGLPMRVVPARRGLSEPLGARGVPTTTSARVLYPSYAPGTRTDLGILHTQSTFPNSVGVWSVNYLKSTGDGRGRSVGGFNPWRGLRVNLCGYPLDLPGTKSAGCRAGATPCSITVLSDPKRTRRCGTTPSYSYNEVRALDEGLIEYLNDTCVGHSGSPVWVKRAASNGGRVLIGVHVRGVKKNGTPVANRAVHIGPAVAKWIRSNLV